MRRWISLAIVMAMFTPAAVSAAEGTMAAWLSPQPGQIVSGARVEVAVGYNTQSELLVTSLELYVDGKFYSRKILGNPESRGVCSFWWDVTREAQGTHNLVVKVLSGDQLISKVYGTGAVGRNGQGRGVIDTRPPVVTFVNISSEDILTGSATIKIHATDDSGEAPMVSLLVDDVLKLIKNTPPYNYDLDTTTYPDGDHSLTTYAYDGAGNKSDPAVVNVRFRNGSQRPVVTTLSVVRQDGELPDEVMEDDYVPSLDPVTESSFSSAGRSVSRNHEETYTAPPAASVKPQPKAVASAPKPVQVAKAATAAPKPVEMPKASLAAPKTVPASAKPDLQSANPTPKPDLRMAAAAPQIAGRETTAKIAAPVLAQEPVKMASATASFPTYRLDAVNMVAAAPVAGKPSATEVAVEPAILTTDAGKAIPANPSALLQQARQNPAVQPAVAAAPITLDSPSASSAGNMVSSSICGDLKQADTSPASLSAPVCAAPVIIDQPARLSKEMLARVQVALAPNLHSMPGNLQASPAIASPPDAPKRAPARIEKPAKPLTGKVKARSFFEDMGGVLFWDSATRTVTAYVGDIVFEMRIGSRVARVNGQELVMDSAPHLIGDRTVFDVGGYAKACALVGESAGVNAAQVR